MTHKLPNPNVRQITKNFHYRDKNIFRLYVQYVRPHMEFASPVWSPWQEQDIQTLEKIEKPAVGMISGLGGESYEEKCKELNLETLQRRREKQDLLELFKMLNGAGDLDLAILFKRPEARTGVATRSTGDPHKLVMPRTRLETRTNFFTVRVVEKWNNLPRELKTAKNVQQFKRGLTNFLG